MGHAAPATTVLFIEDEALISAMVSEEMRESGFEVLEAATGDDGLRYLEAGAPVDIVFTDVNLPGEINGTEFAVRARALRPDLPIVYCSGRYSAFGLQGMVTRSLFIPKPYSPAQVCSLLKRMTERAD